MPEEGGGNVPKERRAVRGRGDHVGIEVAPDGTGRPATCADRRE
jgi:hypothetical protein